MQTPPTAVAESRLSTCGGEVRLPKVRAVDIVSYTVVIVVSYLLGSLPTGYLAGRLRGVDIRTVGSGNIGATNVFRALGKTAGVTVLAIDAFKGFGACRFAPLVFE